MIIRFRERQLFWYNPNRSYRVPVTNTHHQQSKKTGREHHVPNTDKLDININAERLLELVRLLPSCFVFTCIHLVCEGDLLVIARREETDFVDPVIRRKLSCCAEGGAVDLHSSKGTRGIGPTGEPKNKNSISSPVILHQEFVPACQSHPIV